MNLFSNSVIVNQPGCQKERFYRKKIQEIQMELVSVPGDREMDVQN